MGARIRWPESRRLSSKERQREGERERKERERGEMERDSGYPLKCSAWLALCGLYVASYYWFLLFEEKWIARFEDILFV